MDVSNNVNAQYSVYIAGTGTAEAVPVTGGTCTSGGASGTIIVTTANTHAAGYTVGSASSGIQEAINDAGLVNASVALLPSMTGLANYTVYAPVFFNTKKSVLSGHGASVQCFTRSACIINGNYLGTYGSYNTIQGIEFRPGLNVDGVQIASVSVSSGTYTVTTASAHPFVTGDYVTEFYSNANTTQEGRFQITVTGANSYTYSIGSTTFADTPSYGWAAIENAAMEDIGDHVTVRDIKLGLASAGMYFHWGIVIGNDQSFKLDGMTNEGTGQAIRCTANFCGALVYARGDQGAAPVVTIEHLEASTQCNGNGVRYASGNTLHVMNSVIQGFNQYGIYYAGGLQSLMIGGTYQESSGACHNPIYPGTLGANAGIITNSDLTYLGQDPIGGQFPSFLAANTGSQQNNYYVMVHSSAQGSLGMFYIGSCLTSGTGNCTTYWPEPNLDTLGTVTYDELRTVGVNAIPPNGSGSYSIATGISGSCSTAGICSNVDPQTGTSTYAVNLAVYAPRLNFWPGAIVLGKGAHTYMTSCGQASGVITTSYLPTVYCQHAGVVGTAGNNTPYWAVYTEGDSSGNGNPAVGAVLKQAGPASGASPSGLTGLYGFLNPGTIGQTDMMTLAYSNPFLTLATPGYRPSASANDTAIGFDQTSPTGANNAQLAFRAPIAISQYIGGLFDNSTYKERLTASAKTFNVPVTVNGNLNVTGTCTGCGSMVYPGAGIPLSNGSTWGTSVTAPSGAIVGTTDTQTLTNKTVDGVLPSTLAYLANVTSDAQSQLNAKAPLVSPAFTGTVSGADANFSGNIQAGTFSFTGPFNLASTIPSSAMGNAPASQSSLGVSNDGNFYISANAGAPSEICTVANAVCGTGGGGSMTWPGASGIAVYGGSSAWGTSLTAPAGTIVGTSDTQALTNKTYDGLTHTALTAGFSVAGGTTSKTFSVLNTITLQGTDATTLTLPAITTTLPGIGSNNTFTGVNTFAKSFFNFNGTAGNPAVGITGTVFSGGTGTTTVPQMLYSPTGTTAVSTWNTAGTILGINEATGFTGNFLDFHVPNGGASVYSVDYQGDVAAHDYNIPGSFCNPIFYGADPTGASATFETAFAATVASCSNGTTTGLTVYSSAGKYTVSPTGTVAINTNNVHWIGDGRSTVITQAAQATVDGTVRKIVTVTGTNVQISNLAVAGQSLLATDNTTYQDCIYNPSAVNLMLSYIYFSGTNPGTNGCNINYFEDYQATGTNYLNNTTSVPPIGTTGSKGYDILTAGSNGQYEDVTSAFTASMGRHHIYCSQSAGGACNHNVFHNFVMTGGTNSAIELNNTDTGGAQPAMDNEFSDMQISGVQMTYGAADVGLPGRKCEFEAQ